MCVVEGVQSTQAHITAALLCFSSSTNAPSLNAFMHDAGIRTKLLSQQPRTSELPVWHPLKNLLLCVPGGLCSFRATCALHATHNLMACTSVPVPLYGGGGGLHACSTRQSLQSMVVYTHRGHHMSTQRKCVYS